MDVHPLVAYHPPASYIIGQGRYRSSYVVYSLVRFRHDISSIHFAVTSAHPVGTNSGKSSRTAGRFAGDVIMEYLVAAYIAIWTILFFYLVSLKSRLSTLEKTVDSLEKRVRK